MPGLDGRTDEYDYCIKCGDTFKAPSWCPLCRECYEDTEEVLDGEVARG